MGEGEELMFFMVETIAILAGRRLRANETGGFVYGKWKARELEEEWAEGCVEGERDRGMMNIQAIGYYPSRDERGRSKR